MDIYKIKRLVYLSPIANNRFVHAFRFKRTLRYIKRIIAEFGRDPEDIALLARIKHSYTEYHWNVLEYFLFDYENTTDAQRREFCPEYDHNIFCLQVNNFETAKIFRDKWATYQRFGSYFKRKCVYIASSEDLTKEEVKTFLNVNKNFLAKPVGACCGQGIRMFSNDKLENFNDLMKTIGKKDNDGGYLLEPYITQLRDMAILHPESVNTLRIPTINYGDHIEIFHPFLRMGRGSNFVDNGGAGGIFGCIDANIGVVVIAGDERGNVYTHHPDSKVKLEGFVVPKWSEAVDMAMRLASEIPDVHYCGWDLALTEDGWVMIEGNEDGQFIFQYPDHKGVAQEVSKILKTLK